MILRQLNPHGCRTYLADSGKDGAALLVDPVLEHVDEYLELIRGEGLTLTHVIDTHTHADHISGAASLRDRTACEYVMHTRAPAPCVSLRLSDGMTYEFAGIPVTALHTPGHTKDSVSLILADRLLTGDALFLDDGGAGRDDLPGGDPGEHWESLQKLLALPGHLVVHPAHEYRNRQPSSLDRQRKTNPHLAPRTKEAFIAFIEDLRLGPAEWMKDVLKANYACARNPGAAWIPVDLPSCEVKGTMTAGVNEIAPATMSPATVKELLAGGEKPLLLDVREAHELTGELGHIPGIVHIPIGSLARRLGELEAGKERLVVTVCRSGGRAATAAAILTGAGFPRAAVLEGGMIAWNRAN